MVNNQDYMPVECLLVPKALFKEERYCSLSTTAKVLYSLMLDRLKYAAQNRWIDQKGKRYVIYPKSEMIKDLNSTRYRVDYAVSELESMGNMVRVVKDNGRPNRFYINDISKYEEENAMMTIKDLMEMVTSEEAEEIMDKMVETAREIVDDLMKKGYIEIIREGCPEGGHLEDGVPPTDLGEDEFNPENLNPMEFRCYCDEDGSGRLYRVSIYNALLVVCVPTSRSNRNLMFLITPERRKRGEILFCIFYALEPFKI